MLRKMIFGALTLLFTLCMVGCGGGDKPATDNKKSEPAKAEVTADKAVLAYAEMLMTGESANADATFVSDADKAEFRRSFVKEFTEIGPAVPLSEETANAIVEKFYAAFKDKMKFTATLKKDDAEQPVVELKTNPMDKMTALEKKVSVKEFEELLDASGKLQDNGSTPEQIKENAEFQKMALETFAKYFVEYPMMQEEQSLEVTCKKVKGTDGKEHWVPADIEALKKFLMG